MHHQENKWLKKAILLSPSVPDKNLEESNIKLGKFPNNRIESSTDYLEIKIVEYTPNSKLNSSMQSAQAQGTSTKKEGKVDGNDSGGLNTSQKTTVMDALG